MTTSGAGPLSPAGTYRWYDRDRPSTVIVWSDVATLTEGGAADRQDPTAAATPTASNAATAAFAIMGASIRPGRKSQVRMSISNGQAGGAKICTRWKTASYGAGEPTPYPKTPRTTRPLK